MTVDFLGRTDATSTEALSSTDRAMTIELDRTDLPRWLPRLDAVEASQLGNLDVLERLHRYLTIRWNQYTFALALPPRSPRAEGWAVLQRLSNRTVIREAMGPLDDYRLDDAPHPDVWSDLPASRWT